MEGKESSRKLGIPGNMELRKGPVAPSENDRGKKGRIRRLFVETWDSAFPDLSLAVPALQTVVYSRSEKECIRNPHSRSINVNEPVDLRDMRGSKGTNDGATQCECCPPRAKWDCVSEMMMGKSRAIEAERTRSERGSSAAANSTRPLWM